MGLALRDPDGVPGARGGGRDLDQGRARSGFYGAWADGGSDEGAAGRLERFCETTEWTRSTRGACLAVAVSPSATARPLGGNGEVRGGGDRSIAEAAGIVLALDVLQCARERGWLVKTATKKTKTVADQGPDGMEVTP